MLESISLQLNYTRMYSHKHRDQHHKRYFCGVTNPQKKHQRQDTPSIDNKYRRSRQFFYTQPQLSEKFDFHDDNDDNDDNYHHCCHRRHRGHRGHHNRHGDHHKNHRHQRRSENQIYINSMQIKNYDHHTHRDNHNRNIQYGQKHHGSHKHLSTKFQANQNKIHKKINLSDSTVMQWKYQSITNKKESQQQIYQIQRMNKQFQYLGIIQSLKEQVNRAQIQSKNQQNKQNQESPKQFVCPISQQVMENPTIITVCGHSFQKDSLKKWLESNLKCPLCKKACKVSDLQINYNLKAAIQRYYK